MQSTSTSNHPSPNLTRLVCCAPGCPNNLPGAPDQNGNPITFHRFPKNDNVKQHWKQFCNQSDPEFPYEHSRVCSIHFAHNLFRNCVRQNRLMRALHPMGLPSIQHPSLYRQIAKCIVPDCPSESPLFSFPKEITDPAQPRAEQLSRLRRVAWIRVLGLENRPDVDLQTARVCSRHFKGRAPGKLMVVPNADWTPSLFLPRITKPAFSNYKTGQAAQSKQSSVQGQLKPIMVGSKKQVIKNQQLYIDRTASRPIKQSPNNTITVQTSPDSPKTYSNVHKNNQVPVKPITTTTPQPNAKTLTPNALPTISQTANPLLDHSTAFTSEPDPNQTPKQVAALQADIRPISVTRPTTTSNNNRSSQVRAPSEIPTIDLTRSESPEKSPPPIHKLLKSIPIIIKRVNQTSTIASPIPIKKICLSDAKRMFPKLTVNASALKPITKFVVPKVLAGTTITKMTERKSPQQEMPTTTPNVEQTQQQFVKTDQRSHPDVGSIGILPSVQAAAIQNVSNGDAPAPAPPASTSETDDNGLSDLFVNGSMDRSKIGRTVVIDRVINNVRQSFMLELVDGGVDPPAIDHRSKKTKRTSSSTLKRRRKIRSQPIEQTKKPFCYRDQLIRKLSPRFNTKPKKPSFKNLVLTYRTVQKRALRKAAMAEKQRNRKRQAILDNIVSDAIDTTCGNGVDSATMEIPKTPKIT